ncbi:27131_t:CDS:2 [Dentiscutata erythropus]|uniref:27131_t:CDS:1 n=1 Tax=Dentiscutata erythropus TaxID=1348616 RepID=A0A9N9ABR3_9GLOM|nr:27131_t:CDS:2 [Dentiscutata erythropus]
MERPSKIGYLSGVSLLVSSMTGPGLVTGWITSMIIIILVVFLSSSAALLLCEAIGSLPDNEKFTERIEYSNLCATLITDKYKRAFIQIIVYLAIESFIIASIILSAQSLDSLYITLFGVTCGVGIYPDSGWLCIRELGDEASPFGERWMFLTAGFMRIPIIGENQSQAVGIILFNYAFIVTVPSLANELEEDGSIRKIVYTSVAISTFGYISLGILGAMAFDLDLSTNIISSIRQSELRNNILGFSTYLFPFILLISSGYWLNVFTNWTSLFFISSANFIIPFWMYILSRRKQEKEKWHGVEEITHVKRAKQFRAFFPKGTMEWFGLF